MSGQIELTLPYPISANRYWATRIVPAGRGRKAMALTYVTAEAKAYKAEIQKIASRIGLLQPLDQRVSMSIRLYPHRPLDWQKRVKKLGDQWDNSVQCIDLGNCEKVLADALQGVIYTDDKWIWHEEKQRMEPDGEARVVVTIAAIHSEPAQRRLL